VAALAARDRRQHSFFFFFFFLRAGAHGGPVPPRGGRAAGVPRRLPHNRDVRAPRLPDPGVVVRPGVFCVGFFGFFVVFLFFFVFCFFFFVFFFVFFVVFFFFFALRSRSRSSRAAALARRRRGRLVVGNMSVARVHSQGHRSQVLGASEVAAGGRARGSG